MSMLWQRFTERAKRVVIAAQEEAALAGEPYVSPEHLLLGLVKDNDSVATKVLERLGVPAQQVRQEIERQIGGRGYGRLNNNDVTLDPRMKRVLDFAYDEARQASTNYIGTEHLLLGIIREGEGIAFRTLAKLRVDILAARKEVASYLGSEQQAAAAASRRGYEVRRYSDPAEASEWLNGMIAQGFKLAHSSTSNGELWLIVEGWVPNPEAPENPETPETEAPAEPDPSDEASNQQPKTSDTTEDASQ